VNYPGLPDNKYYALAKKYLPKGASGLLNFGVKGGAGAGERFIEASQFMSHLANIGDAKTLVIHPASTTHRQMSDEEQLKAGERFIEAATFMSHLANIGDAKTLIIHPASTTHRQMSEEEQAKAGVTPDMIRISVGLETLDDILWDVDNALSAAAKT